MGRKLITTTTVTAVAIILAACAPSKPRFESQVFEPQGSDTSYTVSADSSYYSDNIHAISIIVNGRRVAGGRLPGKGTWEQCGEEDREYSHCTTLNGNYYGLDVYAFCTLKVRSIQHPKGDERSCIVYIDGQQAAHLAWDDAGGWIVTQNTATES